MRSGAACLTLLFILSLSVVSIIDPQPVKAETTTRYYLQSGDPTTVPLPFQAWRPINVGVYAPNTTVFNMDTLTPQGSEVACSWCDFATRPLTSAHTFRSFKMHLYVRWPPQCTYYTASGPVKVVVNDTYVSFGIGSAASDLSTIYGYQYRDYSYWHITSRETTVLDIGLSGYDPTVGQEVRVGIDSGKRLVVHFGMAPAKLGSDDSCWLWSSGQPRYAIFPTILFGDGEHASYIETDAVELQGQPVPEFPTFLIMLPVILALTILLRKRGNKP